MTVFQQILLHIVVPRIMSESIGMPSSLILISVLIGARLWGIWALSLASRWLVRFTPSAWCCWAALSVSKTDWTRNRVKMMRCESEATGI